MQRPGIQIIQGFTLFHLFVPGLGAGHLSGDALALILFERLCDSNCVDEFLFSSAFCDFPVAFLVLRHVPRAPGESLFPDLCVA